MRALVDQKGKEALRNPRDRTEEGIAEVSCLSSARENPRAVKHPGQRAERRGQGEPRKRVLLYDARMHASAMKLRIKKKKKKKTRETPAAPLNLSIDDRKIISLWTKRLFLSSPFSKRFSDKTNIPSPPFVRISIVSWNMMSRAENTKDESRGWKWMIDGKGGGERGGD